MNDDINISFNDEALNKIAESLNSISESLSYIKWLLDMHSDYDVSKKKAYLRITGHIYNTVDRE